MAPWPQSSLNLKMRTIRKRSVPLVGVSAEPSARIYRAALCASLRVAAHVAFMAQCSRQLDSDC